MRLKLKKTVALRSSYSAAIAMFGFLIFCATAKAEVFVSRYSVSLSGVHIGDAILHTSLNAKTYKVVVSADVSVMLVNTRIHGEASGSRAGAKLAPEHFRMITTGSEERTVETNFAGSPDNAKAAHYLRGLLDPLSALLVTSLKPASPSPPCNHVLPILLGRTRFDLSLHPKQIAGVAGEPAIVDCLAIASDPGAGGQQTLVMEIGFRKLAKPRVWLVEHLSLPTQNGTVAIERAETAVSGS